MWGRGGDKGQRSEIGGRREITLACVGYPPNSLAITPTWLVMRDQGTLRPGAQTGFDLLEARPHAFGNRPAFDLFDVDVIGLGDEDGLFQAFRVVSVVVPGEAVFYAIRGRDDAHDACGCGDLVDLAHGLFADAERAGRELDQVSRVGMGKISVLFGEAERRHRGNDLGPFGECGIDEVEVHRHVFLLAVDRHA